MTRHGKNYGMKRPVFLIRPTRTRHGLLNLFVNSPFPRSSSGTNSASRSVVELRFSKHLLNVHPWEFPRFFRHDDSVSETMPSGKAGMTPCNWDRRGPAGTGTTQTSRQVRDGSNGVCTDTLCRELLFWSCVLSE